MLKCKIELTLVTSLPALIEFRQCLQNQGEGFNAKEDHAMTCELEQMPLYSEGILMPFDRFNRTFPEITKQLDNYGYLENEDLEFVGLVLVSMS